MRASPVIAITLGDPAGIGPEVVAKTLRDPRLPKGFRFEVLGAQSGRGIQAGKLSKTAARSALQSLTEAAQGCVEGRYSAMVTGPVHKLALARIQSDFVGQTEFCARACGLPDDAAVMCLTDPKLTVSLCSNHLSTRDAIARLTPERIVYVTKITREFLRQRGIAKPHIAFAGVNPHLGEGSLFGDEDFRVVSPARETLAAEGIALIIGPADTIFHYAVKRKAFDAVVCAYHDQGLIPFKLVAFETGVNVTLGLPIIRTSPDHRSMLAAVQLACRLVKSERVASESAK